MRFVPDDIFSGRSCARGAQPGRPMIMSFLGWVGTLASLGNHAMLSFGRIERGRPYYSINIGAALLVTVSSAVLPSWQGVAVNGFWVLASVAGYLGITVRLTDAASARGLLAVCLVLAAVAGARAFIDMDAALRWLGWSATVLLCGSYLLFAVERMSQRAFLSCSAVASFCLVPVLLVDQNWPVVALEFVWGVLSVIGLLRLGQDTRA